MIKRIFKKYIKHRLFKDYGKKSCNVDLPGKVEVFFGEKISFIGSCYIGPGAFIDARGGVTFGNNVILAPKVVIITYNHDFKNLNWKPYSSDILMDRVVIGNDCWLGYGVTLLPGTHLGDGCVVSAGSVVRKGNIPPRSILAGNPAIVVGSVADKNSDAQEYQTLMSAKKRWG